MPEADLHACTYWVVRYTPNLVRDEWLNVGVLLFDSETARFDARFIEEDREFGRVLRLHPNADAAILRGLGSQFKADIGDAEDPAGRLSKLEETLSNAVQLSPRHGLMAEDFSVELERLYQQYVARPHALGMAARLAQRGRAMIKSTLNGLLRRAGLSGRVERAVRVDEFTFPGDPLRLDYGYRRNGTRGFVHALSLDRDASQSKVLAYTAERIRRTLAAAEFTVVTDAAPHPENDRHQFVARLLGDQQIGLVPVGELEPWVSRLRGQLMM
ncbi:MAG TPA: DUF3037 domain-containing protein [Candidatus Acidoferrales bacterium]|nr:DUF3037 domain-containing protein [Candidatus Acidoferrales bacterium]